MSGDGRIVFNVTLPAKFRDLKQRSDFKENLADENYTRRLVEQLLAEFREEKERFNEEERKYKLDRIRQELLLSVTSTESIHSILKATAPNPMTPEYESYMAGMIADSLRSETSSMTKSQLKKWQDLYPGYSLISGLVDDHESKEAAVIAKLGKLPGDFTGAELDKLAYEHSSHKPPNLFSFITDDFKAIKSDLGEILTVLSQRSDRTLPLKSAQAMAFRNEHGWPYDNFNLTA